MRASETFEERELDILRNAVDKAEEIRGKKLVQTDIIKDIILIVERFLQQKKLICYGGTAINNILPYEDQFYDKSIEIPDYDFFSSNAMNDAKELADIYHKAGYTEVEAKAGQHYGTYKVFVNFIPVADITSIDSRLFKILLKDSVKVSGIHYSPPDFLRMLMYLELSRPDGDVSRWEKVLKRLTLLNKNYKLKGSNCHEIDFQRSFEEIKNLGNKNQTDIYILIKQTLIDQDVIFFGGYATSLYSHYMPKKLRSKLHNIPDFDVLSKNPEETAKIVKDRLMFDDIKHVSIHKHEGVGEIIAPHYEVRIGKESVVFIYEPIACHSYNVITIQNRKIRIATIDTMLSFFLAFLYANRPYYNTQRILCMAHYLFKVQEKNRLEQKGVLKRFSTDCYGKQETIEEMRAEKANKHKELQDKRNTTEYEEWFLRYVPQEKNAKKKQEKTKKVKTKKVKTKKVKGKAKAKAKIAKKSIKKTKKEGFSLMRSRVFNI
jgi:hypothetical protein